MLDALPCNVDLERLVLGCILADDALLHDVRPALSPDHFSLDQNRRVWAEVVKLYDGGERVDRMTVANALLEAQALESVGGLSYLCSLDDGAPRLPDLSAYVGKLDDFLMRRKLVALGDNIAGRAAGTESPKDVLSSLSASLLDFAPRGATGGLVSAKELVEREGVDGILAPRIKRGLPFPWPWMQDKTSGMLPGELWVLAGHTSTGKTSAAIQVAVHAAFRNIATSVHSLEMGDVSVFQRAVWQVSRVDSERAKKGDLTKSEMDKAREAMLRLTEHPIYFDDSSRSVMEIHAALRRQSARSPVGLVVVDYLQLLEDGGRFDKRADAVGANARRLKLMANEFKCPVLLLSQFNRDSAKPERGSQKLRRPALVDLKESGDIENHANGVWFIHRDTLEDADLIPVTFMLPKQRDGRRDVMTRDGRINFRSAIQTFEEAA
jgi:replicative DNA helicase